MISKEMEKGTPANASIRDAWGQYSTELEERNAVDKAADNMRIALTCWANATKLVRNVNDGVDVHNTKKRLQVDRSLSAIFASITLT